MYKEYIIDIFMKNKGKFIGALIGLLFALFVLLIGFFKTIFIVICVYIGYYIGRKLDNNENFLEIVEKVFLNYWK